MPKEIFSHPLIRVMREEDLAFAAHCTAAEGWSSENYATLEGIFIHDQAGCLIALLDGQPVGICMATSYGKSGFIGELIVCPAARGHGVGAALLRRAVLNLQERGAETIYLDGVLKAVGLYERNGFHKVCRSWRFSGRVTGGQSSSVRHMCIADLEQVIALDKSSFGADRGFFLRRRLESFPKLCYVLTGTERVLGFIFGRSGEGWISAGPWVVAEQAERPEALLKAFAIDIGDNPISIGILDANKIACDLVRSLGFVENPDSPWRMELGSHGELGISRQCYAVGSGAKG